MNASYNIFIYSFLIDFSRNNIYYFILNAGVTDGEEITHGVLQGKIEYKPGAFDPFWNRDDAVARLESEEIRKQMEELGVQMEIVQMV